MICVFILIISRLFSLNQSSALLLSDSDALALGAGLTS